MLTLCKFALSKYLVTIEFCTLEQSYVAFIFGISNYVLFLLAQLVWISGMIRDKAMDKILINIPNNYEQNYPFSRLVLLVEKIGYC